MKKNKFKGIISCVFIMVLLCFTTCPEKKPDQVLAAVTTEQRTVRVAVGINNALYLDQKGNIQGYCADYRHS